MRYSWWPVVAVLYHYAPLFPQRRFLVWASHRHLRVLLSRLLSVNPAIEMIDVKVDATADANNRAGLGEAVLIRREYPPSQLILGERASVRECGDGLQISLHSVPF